MAQQLNKDCYDVLEIQTELDFWHELRHYPAANIGRFAIVKCAGSSLMGMGRCTRETLHEIKQDWANLKATRL